MSFLIFVKIHCYINYLHVELFSSHVVNIYIEYVIQYCHWEKPEMKRPFLYYVLEENYI